MSEMNLQRLIRERNPIIEGDTAVFLWHGDTAPALMGDFNDWDESKSPSFSNLSPGLWAVALNFTPDAYMEYTFVMKGERTPDPYNRHRIPNGLGNYNNYFYMPDAHPSPLRRCRPGIVRGNISHHPLTHPLYASGKRTVHLYRPPVPGPSPLVVVFDGKDYLRRADLPVIVDNLIAAGRIRPLALAMVDNAGPLRTVEYTCSEAVIGYLFDSVLRLAQKELDLTDPQTPQGTYGVLGASLGGLMALFTGLRLPSIFGKVLSQSGAFGFGEHRFALWDLIRGGVPLPAQVWMNAGRYEWLLQSNREMAALLRERGTSLTYTEYSAGHNYTAWGNTLAAGLETCFPLVA